MISTTDITKFKKLQDSIVKYEKHIPRILTSYPTEKLKFFMTPKQFISMVIDFTSTYRDAQSWSIPHSMKGKLVKYDWGLVMKTCNEINAFIKAFEKCIKKSGMKGDTVEAINKIIDDNNLNKEYISIHEIF